MSCMGGLLLAAASIPLLAQSPAGNLALFILDGRGYKLPIGGFFDLGSAAPGDFLETAFRLRNVSSTAVTVSSLRIAGTGFSLENTPSLPMTLTPSGNADFKVRFRPHGAGTSSATLTADGLSVLVRSVGRVDLTVVDEKGVALSTSAPLDFGTLSVGQSGRRRLILRNESVEALAVRQLGAGGTGFSLSPHPPPPFLLAPGVEMPIELICSGARAGALIGSFSVDARVFSLVAFVRAPQYPDAWLALDAQAGRRGAAVDFTGAVGFAYAKGGVGYVEDGL